VTSLTTGDFMIAFDGKTCMLCNYSAYIQKYDINGSAISSNTPVNMDTLSDHYDSSVVGLKNGGYIVAWRSLNQYSLTSSSDVYMNIWYGDEINVVCKDISVYLKTESITAIDFRSNITDDYIEGVNIVFNSLTTAGSLVLSNGNTVSASTPYPNDTIFYQSEVASVTYIINHYVIDYFGNKSLSCNLNISICYSTCETCNRIGRSTDHMCLTCKPGFIRLKTNCLDSCPESFGGYGYYTDKPANQCIQCMSSCNRCLGPNTCIDCISGYYLNNNICVQECPIGYYLSEDNNCIMCKSLNRNYSLGQCVSQCPINEYPDINNICGTCSKLLYNNRCFEASPEGTLLNSIDNTCYTCSENRQFKFNNLCIDKCPEGYFIENNKCQTCSNKGMFLYNNECIEECPEGTYKI
jgi:hypothetical protein